MKRLVMSANAAALAAALTKLCGGDLSAVQSTDWASLTFFGERVVYTFKDTTSGFGDLDNAEFNLPFAIVAGVVVAAQSGNEATVEALLVSQ